jgi:hypothetical protein
VACSKGNRSLYVRHRPSTRWRFVERAQGEKYEQLPCRNRRHRNQRPRFRFLFVGRVVGGVEIVVVRRATRRRFVVTAGEVAARLDASTSAWTENSRNCR